MNVTPKEQRGAAPLCAVRSDQCRWPASTHSAQVIIGTPARVRGLGTPVPTAAMLPPWLPKVRWPSRSSDITFADPLRWDGTILRGHAVAIRALGVRGGAPHPDLLPLKGRRSA